jgi:hypothetical protein
MTYPRSDVPGVVSQPREGGMRDWRSFVQAVEQASRQQAVCTEPLCLNPPNPATSTRNSDQPLSDDA